MQLLRLLADGLLRQSICSHSDQSDSVGSKPFFG